MNADPSEEWRPVIGYEGYYEVSNRGRVRSVPREYPFTRYGKTFMQFRPGRLLKLRNRPNNGYIDVCLRAAALGQPHAVHLVHKLVLEAFVGHRPPGLVACHYDGDKSHNYVSNLRWDTQAANIADSLRLGVHAGMHKRTHCPRGHDYHLDKRGHRRCRPCNTEQARTRHRRIRNEKQGAAA